MSDQVATRYGVLGRDLSIAVLQVIVLASRDAVNALNDVCLHAARVDALPPGYKSSPLSRWQEFLGNLFPTEILIVDGAGSPSPCLVELPETETETEQRAIRRLLGAAAAFLVSVSARVDEVWALAEATMAAHAAFAREARSQARLATAASDLLLDHAEAGSWRALLATFVGDQTLAAQEVPAADVLPRDREFPPVVVSFDEKPTEEDLRRWFQPPRLGVKMAGLGVSGKTRLVVALKVIARVRNGWELRLLGEPELDMPPLHDAAPPTETWASRPLPWDAAVETPPTTFLEWLQTQEATNTPQYRSRVAAAVAMVRRHDLTARIADLVVRVGPDIAPAVGTAFRALATASIGGDDVVRTSCGAAGRDPEAMLARELTPLLQLVSHDHPPEERRGVSLPSLFWLLPEDKAAAFLIATACLSTESVAKQLEHAPGPADVYEDAHRAPCPVADGSRNADRIHLGLCGHEFTERSRLRVTRKPFLAGRSDGYRVQCGAVSSRIQRNVSDPDGWAWELLTALDGTRTLDEVVATLTRSFPDTTTDEIRAAIDEMVRGGYVEDAGAVDALTARESERYSRSQELLRWMDRVPRRSGWDTQLLLRQARVVVVGVGGVGSSAALALAQSGVGELHLVEPDAATAFNLNRHALFHEWDLGRPKVDVMIERVRERNCEITVTGETAAVTGPATLAELAARCDLLVLAVDHPQGIRSWTNHACAQTKTPWVYSGHHGTHVTVGLYLPGTGPCYDCTSLAEHDQRDELPLRPPAYTAPPAATAAVAGVAGHMAAHAACSLLSGMPEMPANRQYGFDLATLENNIRSLDACRPDCPTCGQNARSIPEAGPRPPVVNPADGSADGLARSAAQAATPRDTSRPATTGTINWNAYTHEQLYEWLQTPGASQVSSIADDWLWQSTELADIASILDALLTALLQNWSGPAAELAGNRLVALAKRVSNCSDRAASTGHTIQWIADAHCQARNTMPPPVRQPDQVALIRAAITGGGDSVFWASAAATAGKAQAVSVMQQYEASLADANPPDFGASVADDERINRLSDVDHDLVDNHNDASPVTARVRGRDDPRGEVIVFRAEEVNAQIAKLAAVRDRIGTLADSAHRLAQQQLLLGTAPPAVHLASRLQEAAGPSGLCGEIGAANTELTNFVAALKASVAMYLEADAACAPFTTLER
ncbi:ThiF family adenylyltransferase [Kutzneria buriramensis]|uniref:ThiF family adenylyltransferase n=1 Tax=Kutzneria buriramensis TaxID=1045776 RepID=UPI000E23B007|nr:ThiF family adenylyltransferase [Kutzneria buriramensis]